MDECKQLIAYRFNDVTRPGKFVYKQEIYTVTIEPAHDVSESEHSIPIN